MDWLTFTRSTGNIEEIDIVITVRRFGHRLPGQGLVEYGLVVAAVALAALIGAQVLQAAEHTYFVGMGVQLADVDVVPADIVPFATLSTVPTSTETATPIDASVTPGAAPTITAIATAALPASSTPTWTST